MTCYPTAPLKPQLDRDEPSYVAALARCHAQGAAPPGDAAHADGLISAFGARPLTPANPETPVRPRPLRPPSPRLVRRSARPVAPTRRAANPTPVQDRVVATLTRLGRPATIEELAGDDTSLRRAVHAARKAGRLRARTTVTAGQGRRQPAWSSLYALPGMDWPELPAGTRYWAGARRRGADLLSVESGEPTP